MKSDNCRDITLTLINRNRFNHIIVTDTTLFTQPTCVHKSCFRSMWWLIFLLCFAPSAYPSEPQIQITTCQEKQPLNIWGKGWLLVQLIKRKEEWETTCFSPTNSTVVHSLVNLNWIREFISLLSGCKSSYLLKRFDEDCWCWLTAGRKQEIAFVIFLCPTRK